MTTRTNRTRAAGLLAGALMLLVAAPAGAATLIVGNGETPCPGATYTTIQSAVNAAAAHDDVAVCAGTYVEQITVPAGKDGLVLYSQEPLAAILRAPATMADPGDIVRIHGAREVTLHGFTIAGPLPDALFCSVFPRTGVRVDGGGSAVIRANRVIDIRSADPARRGCQNGVPIMVGSRAEGEIGSATIDHNTIETYEKTGVLVDNAGSSAAIVGNVVTGDGPTAMIAQTGIEVSNGAEAYVGNNVVSGQIYSRTPLASGLLFALPGRLAVIGNIVHDADYGIVTLDAKGPLIEHNTVAACTANGIDLDESAVGTTDARLIANESHANGQDGIYVSVSSSGNDVSENELFGNRQLDARDDSSGKGTAGTANAWLHEQSRTDNHSGYLCEP
jgi:parallel beta-helix repeat protein